MMPVSLKSFSGCSGAIRNYEIMIIQFRGPLICAICTVNMFEINI